MPSKQLIRPITKRVSLQSQSNNKNFNGNYTFSRIQNNTNNESLTKYKYNILDGNVKTINLTLNIKKDSDSIDFNVNNSGSHENNSDIYSILTSYNTENATNYISPYLNSSISSFNDTGLQKINGKFKFYIVFGILLIILILIIFMIIFKTYCKGNSKKRINKVKSADKKRAKATKKYLKEHKSLIIPVDKNGLPKKNKGKKKNILNKSTNVDKNENNKIKKCLENKRKKKGKQIKLANFNEKELEQMKTARNFNKNKKSIGNLEEDKQLNVGDKIENNKQSISMHEKQGIKGNDRLDLDSYCNIKSETFGVDEGTCESIKCDFPLTLNNSVLQNNNCTSLRNVDKAFKSNINYRELSDECSFKISKKNYKCPLHDKNERVSIYMLYGINKTWIKNEDKIKDFSFQIVTESSESNCK